MLWKAFLLIDLCLVLALGTYLFSLHREMEQRFSAHKWSIPSRVFSGQVPIYPGQAISLSQVKQMLELRRYRAAMRDVASAGEYQEARDSLTVYFREFNFSGRNIPAQKVRFSFQQNRIATMESDAGPLAVLELEPIEIARLFGPERESRILVSIRQVPRRLIDAVLAIEDHRFYEHGGVDFVGITRALWTDMWAGRVVQGGSTITQQLIKNYFLDSKRTFRRKIVEFCMSLIFEAYHSKDEILEMYLNEIYLGQRGSVAVHGVGEAARHYFGRNVEDLTLAEAALLAGVIRAPATYSPFADPAAAKDRRNTVLKRMLELGKITAQEYDKTIGEPVGAAEAFLPVKTAPYYVDYVRQQLHELYAPEVIETTGLNIYTSLQPEISFAAEEAVREGLQDLEKKYPKLRSNTQNGPLQAVLIAVQPKTGSVLALVGGRDYSRSNFNRALYAYRQPGSAIKPLVYLSALDQFSLTAWLPDEPVTFTVGDKTWSPQNYDGQYRGRVTLREALEHSLNVPTVHLALSVGLDKIIATAQDLGISSPIHPEPSLALGAFEVTPIELAGAYTTFDNDGERPYLLSLKEVVTDKGEVQQRRNMDLASVTTPAKSFLITDMLEGVMLRGTAKTAKQLGIDFPCAGKTGTTSEYRDSWFVGYTTDLLVLVWVGFDNNEPTQLSGAQGALTLWTKFFNRVRPWMNPEPFLVPQGVQERLICTASGQLAGPACPDKKTEFFLDERVPGEYCTIHGAPVQYSVPGAPR